METQVEPENFPKVALWDKSPHYNKMKTELQIEGMTCEACAGFVANALQNVEGVKRAFVELSTNRAEVEGEEYDVADLIESVEEEGYGARVLD